MLMIRKSRGGKMVTVKVINDAAKAFDGSKDLSQHQEINALIIGKKKVILTDNEAIYGNRI
jgi:hypothetical protein